MAKAWRNLIAVLVSVAVFFPFLALANRLTPWVNGHLPVIVDDNVAVTLAAVLAGGVGAAVIEIDVMTQRRRRRQLLAIFPDARRGRLPTVGRVAEDVAAGRRSDLLGVQHAIPLPASVHGRFSTALPSYIARDLDQRLDDYLAHHMKTGGFLLLVGESAAGKTRTALRGAAARLGRWRLLVPTGGEQLNQLIRADVDVGRSVIWLDNIHQFLTGADALNVTTIQHLRRRRRGPVLIIGTVWPTVYAQLTAEAPAGPVDSNAAARAVLRQVDSDGRFVLDAVWSPAELERAEASTDPRIVEALAAGEDAKLGQALASVPDLIHKWRDGIDPHLGANPYGQAVLTAAILCRIVGHPEPIPAKVLHPLAEALLTDRQRGEAEPIWFHQAIAWARLPVRGSAAALYPVATQAGVVDGYRLADPLLQDAQTNPTRPAGPATAEQLSIIIGLAEPAACLDIGNTVNQAGDRDAAEQAWRQAVTGHRQLVELNRAAYLPDLAMSVNNHAVGLAEVGRREEALGVSEEAVTLYRQLVELNRAAYLPDLAMSVNNHALRLAEVGRREEALGVSEEAVALRRQLVELNRAAYLPDLAMSVNNHALRLAEVGRREEALGVSEEAVTLRRQLVELNRAAYLPNLAASVNNHALRLAEVGRREEALGVSEEAVTLYRQLVELNRAAYLPNLAASVNNHALRLAEVGRREEALGVSEEAVTLRRQLVELNRAAYLPDLAMSVNNHALRLAEVGRREEALGVSEEAVTLRRQLVELNRAAYLPNLAASVNNHAALLAEVGRREEALGVSEEAVTLRRQLVELNRAAYLPNLAASVNNHALRLAEVGRREEALGVSEEAVTLYRQLVELNRAAYLPNLAASVNNHALRLAEVGRREEALGVSEEAVTLYRQLVELNRAAYLPNLATSLWTAGHIRVVLHERMPLTTAELTDGLALVMEAVTIYTDLAQDQPEGFTDRFQSAQQTLTQLREACVGSVAPGADDLIGDAANPQTPPAD